MLRIQTTGPIHEQYVLNKEADNYANMTAQYYYDQIVGRTEDQISVYVMGEFGAVVSGLPCYPQFSRKLHISQEPLYNPDLMIDLSFDFGSTPAMVVKQITDRGEINIVASLQGYKTNLLQSIAFAIM